MSRVQETMASVLRSAYVNFLVFILTSCRVTELVSAMPYAWWAYTGELLTPMYPNVSRNAGPLSHLWTNPDRNSWQLTIDSHGSPRVRSSGRYGPGVIVSARILLPSPASAQWKGVVSTFYFSSDESTDFHDEIDFEFLGKDSTVVQTNYFVNGTGGHEATAELGFDGSADFHSYGIFYGWDEIIWFVDDTILRQLNHTYGALFPSWPCYLYSSMWDGSSVGDGTWVGNSYNLSNGPQTLQVQMAQIQFL